MDASRRLAGFQDPAPPHWGQPLRLFYFMVLPVRLELTPN